MRQSKLDIRVTHFVLQRSLVVGVDISKKRLSAYACTPEGLPIGRATFDNTGPGFRTLVAWVERLKRQNGFSSAVVGTESTGSYGKPLQRFLYSRGLVCVQVNPAHVKKYKDLMDNSPDKNDKKDPVIIATLVREGKFLTSVIPRGVFAALRRCVRARERAVLVRTELINALESIVFEAFPEFFTVFPRLNTRTARSVLAHCPTPQAVRDTGVEKLTRLIERASRGRSGRGLAEALLTAAQESAGIWDAEPEYREEVRFLLYLILILDNVIRHWEKRMEGLLAGISYASYILSIPGISVVTTAALLSELGDLERYRTARQILKQAGLNLYQLSSGNHQGRPRATKRGSPILRKYLYLSAMAVVNSRNQVYRDFYQRYAARSSKTKALMAVMRKLLVLVLALVRQQQYYEPNRRLATV